MVARAGGYACTDPSRSDFLLVRVIFFPPGVPLLLLFPVRLVRSTPDNFNRWINITCSLRLSLALCLELSPVSVRSLQTNTKPLCCRHGGLVSLSVLQHRGLVSLSVVTATAQHAHGRQDSAR